MGAEQPGSKFAYLGNQHEDAVSGDIQAPVPFINLPLVPDATAPGGPDCILTVNGTGFVSGSVVNWNGGPQAATFVNSSQLAAAIPAAEIGTAGRLWAAVPYQLRQATSVEAATLT